MVRAFVFLLGLGLIFVLFFTILRGRGAEDVGWSGVEGFDLFCFC